PHLPGLPEPRPGRDRRERRPERRQRAHLPLAHPRELPDRPRREPRLRLAVLPADDAEHLRDRPAGHRAARARRLPRRGRAAARAGHPGPAVIARATAVLALLAASGCATIQPWQRERLAEPDMQFGGASELAAAESHATEVREGAVGGFDAAGGGCGCN